jgi:hypothetical protein
VDVPRSLVGVVADLEPSPAWMTLQGRRHVVGATIGCLDHGVQHSEVPDDELNVILHDSLEEHVDRCESAVQPPDCMRL